MPAAALIVPRRAALAPEPTVGLTPGFTRSAGQYLLHVALLVHRFTPLLSIVYR